MSNTVEFTILGVDKFSAVAMNVRSSVNDIAKDLIKIGAVAAAGIGFAAKSIVDVGKKTEKSP